MTGRYEFDRYGWTGRQAGCQLFRIGQLEYEISPRAGRVTIEIHIPSDADFSPASVEESLKQARAFFADMIRSCLIARIAAVPGCWTVS